MNITSTKDIIGLFVELNIWSLIRSFPNSELTIGQMNYSSSSHILGTEDSKSMVFMNSLIWLFMLGYSVLLRCMRTSPLQTDFLFLQELFKVIWHVLSLSLDISFNATRELVFCHCHWFFENSRQMRFGIKEIRWSAVIFD